MSYISTSIVSLLDFSNTPVSLELLRQAATARRMRSASSLGGSSRIATESPATETTARR